jgi:hypothetical protein
MSSHSRRGSKFTYKIMFAKRKCMPNPVENKHAKIGLFVKKGPKKIVFIKKKFWGKFYILFLNGNITKKLCFRLDTLRMLELD